MSAAAVIALRRKKLIARFRDAGATDMEHAVTLNELSEHSSWIFEQMARQGVFLSTPDNRYYLDERVAEEFLRMRGQRALLAGGLLLLVLLLLWLLNMLC